MTATGWTGEGPDGAPAMPVTELLLSNRERRAGVLETALARSRAAEAREARDEAAGARDPDEYAAGLVNRGYMPGMVSQLSMKLADTIAELEGEEAKIERGARRQAIAMREHAAGRIDAWAVSRMLDGDQGDAHRAAQLQRRAESLRAQIGEASAMIAPRPEPPDQFASANRTARELFAATTRQRMAEAQAGVRRSEPRPFAGRGSVAARSEYCVWCTREGLDDDTSYLIHSDPELALPTTSPEQLAQLEQADQAAGRSAGYQEIA